MATSADPLLLDTSAAVALVQPEHPKHPVVRQVCRGRRLGLSGHAQFETYSVLTRLPPPQRLTPGTAWRLIRTNFPETRHLPVSRAAHVVDELVGLSLAGGAIYDALVGLTARHHGLQLLTLDTRAAATFRALMVDALVL